MNRPSALRLLALSAVLFQSIQANPAPPDPIPADQENTIQASPPYAFLYGFDFHFLLDNLEESQAYNWATRTLFSAAAHPEIGLSFYNQYLKIGAYGIFDMGHQHTFTHPLSLTLSYGFDYKGLSGVFGIFPRTQWLGHYPYLFYRTDYLFYNPLSSGVMFQYKDPQESLKTEFLLDWTGGDLSKNFDEFNLQGFVEKSFFQRGLYFGGSFLLYHFLNSDVLSQDQAFFNGRADTYLLDRLYYQIFLGTDLRAYAKVMDKLSFEISSLASLERKRTHSGDLAGFKNLQGLGFDFQAQYKGFGVANSLYFGDSQYAYYRQYGANFYAGVPFYQSPFYDRAEIYYEYKNSYITGRFSVILHFTQQGVANQEMLTIHLDTHKLFQSFKHH